MKSQTAVSVWFPLCHFPKNKENPSEKRFSICIRYDRKLGDTGEWGQSREAKRTPLAFCAIVLKWYTNITLPHCLSHTHTHTPSITHILYKQWHLWQKLEMALLRSWNYVHVTVPGLNCLCLTVLGLESKDIYLLNHFRISLPASTQSSTALPSGTNRPPERLDIIATSLRHREADQRRNNKFNGFLVQW